MKRLIYHLRHHWHKYLTVLLATFIIFEQLTGFSLQEQLARSVNRTTEPTASDDGTTDDQSNLSALDQPNTTVTNPTDRATISSTPTPNFESQNIEVYDRRNRAVVNISTQVLTYNLFLQPVPRRGATGSGTIISTDGLILTNHHVIENATEVTITLHDGTTYEGEVIGRDIENDLAVVQFTPDPATTLHTIPFGSSTSLKVGSRVLAIGNPFGLDRTLTTGIISGINRPVQVSNNLVVNNMLQTDASINPGNSGGPLLDVAGNLIGVNTAIFSPSGGSVGIGFAVPVETVERVVPDLITLGSVPRGWIDIVPRQLFPRLVRYARLPVDSGILVSEVTEGGNAERAGIMGGNPSTGVRYGNTIIYIGGDIITEINGQPVSDISTYLNALENTRVGDIATVTVVRGNSTQTLTVLLGSRPDNLNIQ